MSPPESFWDAMPDDATAEAVGTFDDLRGRLDAILDLGMERLAGLPDDRLALPTRWSGFPVTLGFRIGRWSSHIREHTIQVEKTLAMLGHVPTEPARLARHLLAAYGRAEAAVFGRLGVDEAVARIAQGAAEARVAVRSAKKPPASEGSSGGAPVRLATDARRLIPQAHAEPGRWTGSWPDCHSCRLR